MRCAMRFSSYSYILDKLSFSHMLKGQGFQFSKLLEFLKSDDLNSISHSCLDHLPIRKYKLLIKKLQNSCLGDLVIMHCFKKKILLHGPFCFVSVEITRNNFSNLFSNITRHTCREPLVLQVMALRRAYSQLYQLYDMDDTHQVSPLMTHTSGWYMDITHILDWSMDDTHIRMTFG